MGNIGKEKDGIFLNISFQKGDEGDNEMILSTIISNGYTPKKYNGSSLCWSPKEEGDKDDTIRFVVGFIDDSGLVY